MEIIRIYKEEKRKGITTNSEQQNNQNEEPSEIYVFCTVHCNIIILYKLTN
jgi:hypothetical protein